MFCSARSRYETGASILEIILAILFVVVIVYLVVAAVGWLIGGDERVLGTIVHIDKMEFSPKVSGYDLNWPGPPRRPWTYQDRKDYAPTITLEEPAPFAFTIKIKVKESHWWFDPTLGEFEASFQPDRVGATSFKTFNPEYPEIHQVPRVTADPFFWLVCTERGRVKGNTGKGDDRHAEVYIQHDSENNEIISMNKAKSDNHTVRCL